MRRYIRSACLLTLFVSISCIHAQSTVNEAARAADRAIGYYLNSTMIYGGFAGFYDEPSNVVSLESGTPRTGTAFLRLYQATGDERYLDAAKLAAASIIDCQLASGGWAHELDIGHRVYYTYREQQAGIPQVSRSVTASFDDGSTQRPLTFLIELDQATGRSGPVHDAVMRAIAFMLDAQFDNGAWCQLTPGGTGYHRWYTFNDGAINTCTDVMLKAYHVYGDERCLQSAVKAGEFIIASQLAEPQPGWAQQYDYDMQPAWGREFEPPAVCSAVTSKNVETLTKLYLQTGEDRFLEPIPRAIAWLERSRVTAEDLERTGVTALRPEWVAGMSARFYELGTNRIIFGDRGHPLRYYYTYTEISAERQRGYGWIGDYGTSRTGLYNDVMAAGREAYLAAAHASVEPDTEALEAAARRVIERQAETGPWLYRDQWVHMGTFLANADTLAQFLSASEYRAPEYSGPVVDAVTTDPAQITTTTTDVKITARLSSAPEGCSVVVDVSPLAVGAVPVPPAADARLPMYDDGTHGDDEAGDGTYTALYTRAVSPHAVFQTVPGEHRLIVLVKAPDGAWNFKVQEFTVVPGPAVETDTETVPIHNGREVVAMPVIYGFPPAWRCTGPFPHPWGTLGDILPEAAEVDPASDQFDVATLTADSEQLAWQPVGTTDNGYVDLKRTVSAADTVLSYCVAWIEIPEETRARILFGCNDVATIYVNTTEVHSDTIAGGAKLDRDSIDVVLPAGRSSIVVKSGDAGGSAWGFFLRIVDENGRALRNAWVVREEE